MNALIKNQINSCFLLLGSNIGNRYDYLSKALRMINEKGGTFISKSSVYETEPCGFVSNDYFLNMVVELSTGRTPGEILIMIKTIEKTLGRSRTSGKYLSRTIDIDILFYNELTLQQPDLIIPHPLIPERRFILEPMHEIAPGFSHPVLHKTVARLLKECTDLSEVKKVSLFL